MVIKALFEASKEPTLVISVDIKNGSKTDFCENAPNVEYANKTFLKLIKSEDFSFNFGTRETFACINFPLFGMSSNQFPGYIWSSALDFAIYMTERDLTVFEINARVFNRLEVQDPLEDGIFLAH